MNYFLPQYSCYRACNLPWLSDLPSHWQVAQVKTRFSVQLGKMLQNHPVASNDLQVPYLRALHVQWLHLASEQLPTMWASERDIEVYGVKQGDLLACEGGEGGRCAVVRGLPEPCIIQNALHRVRAKQDDCVEYLQYALYAISKTGWIEAITNKATIAHFTADKFNWLQVPFPTPAEQRAIVRYLNSAEVNFTRLVRNKRRLIALLNEEKQAIIQQAVTRGLDPNLQMKPSGVEWLDEIPAHWERRAVWQLFEIGRGQVTSHEYIGSHPGPYPLYSSQTANDGIMGYIDSYMFDGDYLTWTTDGAHAGTVFRRAGRFSCTNVCGTLLPKSPVDLRYMQLALSTETKRVVRQDINPKLMNNMMGRIRVSTPPIAEQTLIADFLENSTKPIDRRINLAKREIDLIREYRTRLIADVVTGQLDVREPAAALHDIEPEAIDAGLDEAGDEMDEGEELDDEAFALSENADAAD